MRLPLLGRAGLLGTALAGVVAGHALTYLLLFSDAATRHQVLARTGHGYWELAAGAAALASLISAGAAVVRHLRAGRRPRPVSGLPFGPFLARLVPLQIVLFLALEATERLATGGLHLSSHRLALVGTVLQALVAVGLALALRALAGLARVIGRALARRASPGAASARPPLRSVHVTTPHLDGARTPRGPPAALAS